MCELLSYRYLIHTFLRLENSAVSMSSRSNLNLFYYKFVFYRGARHGLKALGKLARIEEQEKLLLTLPKYDGYSHTKKTKKAKDESILSIEEKTIEDTSLTDENDTSTNIHKRKKKKYCKVLNLSENAETMVDVNELLNGQDIDSMKNEFVNKKSKKKRKKDKSRDNISK